MQCVQPTISRVKIELELAAVYLNMKYFTFPYDSTIVYGCIMYIVLHIICFFYVSIQHILHNMLKLHSEHSLSISFISMPVLELGQEVYLTLKENSRKNRLTYIKLLLTCI